MPGPVVVVTFYSRGGQTERLATAAAVGAVQARAGIRMRRLPEPDLEATAARYPVAAETLRRMRKEYVPPKEADLLAADGIIIGLPEDAQLRDPEVEPFFEALRALGADRRLSGKVAAAVGRGTAAAEAARVLRDLGLVVVPFETGAPDDVLDDAVALGRRVVAAVESARSRASSTAPR